MNIQAILLLWSFLIFAVTGAAASYRTVHITDFPLSNRDRATVSTAFLNPAKSKHHEMIIELKPERSRVRYVEKRHKIPVDFLPSAGSDELVLIVPGLGGFAQGGMISYLAEQVNALGKNVLTIPNALNWQFALGGSRNAYPGYVPQDVEDLLPLIRESLARIRAGGARFRQVSVMGYSLGGLHAAHLAPALEDRLGLNIKKIILMNPPFDVDQGVGIIDGLYGLGERFSQTTKDLIWGTMIGLFQNLGGRTESEKFENMEQSLKLNSRTLSWLVGDTFRDSLSAIIYVSQQVEDRGVLNTPQGNGYRSLRQSEAKKFSFRDYLGKIVGPEIMKAEPGTTMEQIMWRAGLRSLQNRLRHDTRYILIHTEDDFLATPELKSWAADTFGERAIFFDHGGHLGQLWTPEFKRVLKHEL